MQVSKWGNSLAVRLPKDVVDGLGLKEGDEVEIAADSNMRLLIQKRMTRDEAREALWKHRRPLPPGFKFDRDEANER